MLQHWSPFSIFQVRLNYFQYDDEIDGAVPPPQDLAEQQTMVVQLLMGLYLSSIVDAEPLQDDGSIAVSLKSGSLDLNDTTTGSQAVDTAGMTVSLLSGGFNPTVIDTGLQTDAGTLTPALKSGSYDLVIFSITPPAVEDAAINCSLKEGEYAL